MIFYRTCLGLQRYILQDPNDFFVKYAGSHMESGLLYPFMVGFNVENRNFMDLWRFSVKHMDTSH